MREVNVVDLRLTVVTELQLVTIGLVINQNVMLTLQLSNRVMGTIVSITVRWSLHLGIGELVTVRLIDVVNLDRLRVWCVDNFPRNIR